EAAKAAEEEQNNAEEMQAEEPQLITEPEMIPEQESFIGDTDVVPEAMFSADAPAESEGESDLLAQLQAKVKQREKWV
ncbi:MAG: hypothetical protein II035_03115, partial [Firmicutes bacterium]|nr:hypothetical protein [Bacillota bacterium]